MCVPLEWHECIKKKHILAWNYNVRIAEYWNWVNGSNRIEKKRVMFIDKFNKIGDLGVTFCKNYKRYAYLPWTKSSALSLATFSHPIGLMASWKLCTFFTVELKTNKKTCTTSRSTTACFNDGRFSYNFTFLIRAILFVRFYEEPCARDMPCRRSNEPQGRSSIGGRTVNERDNDRRDPARRVRGVVGTRVVRRNRVHCRRDISSVTCQIAVTE